MTKIKIKDGDWVKISRYNSVVIGYVIKAETYRAQVQPIHPYSKDETYLYTYDSNYEILPLDIDNKMVDDMIDFALKIKDEKWFYELVEMRSSNKEKTTLHTEGSQPF